MSDIDWSKAPEGATHFAPKREDSDMWCAVFWRLENAVGVEAWQVCNDTGQLHHVRWPTWLPETASRLIARPSAWTGEGLPPVGVECEHQGTADSMDWMAVKIIAHTMAHGRDVAVFQYGNTVSFSSAPYFRPIRTPEQIAAEEREKAIQEMVETCAHPGSTHTFADCERLYDACYRKTEAP